MTVSTPILHMVCGKIGSGKSTLASKLAASAGTVLISEDAWLSALFSSEMKAASDYVRCAAKLRAAMGPHVVSLLSAGVSVVLDFPANTIENRNWMRGIIDATNAHHELHVLDVPDAVCLTRLHERNAQGDHPFSATEEQFRRFAKHYVEPSPEEGFNIIWHSDSQG